jgi:hypothetical protein
MVEGKTAQISKDFLRLFGVIAYIGGGLCGVLAAINPAFLKIWTSGLIQWEPVNNLLMAASAYTFLLIRCVTDFVLHTKKVGWMPLLMCCEGLLFVAAAMWLLPRYGLTGMLVASLLISGILRLPYAWTLFLRYLGPEAPRFRQMARPTLLGVALGATVWFLLMLIPRFSWDLGAAWILGLQLLAAFLAMGPLLVRLVNSLRRA